ncbi:hypothetical protein GVAV_003385, partial [Gurleya vavrai]
MANLLRKNWKDNKKKKAVCPLNWNEQKEKSKIIKESNRKEKSVLDIRKAKKREYM